MAEGDNPEVPKSPEKKRLRRPYKPPMGCMAKFLIFVVVVVVLMLGVMAVHYHVLKGSNPELTVTDYLTFTWSQTKETVGEYKEKALEWKDWLAKSDKAIEWLDNMFPETKKQPEIAGESGNESEEEKTAKPAVVEGETTDKNDDSQKSDASAKEDERKEQTEEMHPEFLAAGREFRRGLVYFKQKENNKAFEHFRNAQDHIEAYRQINPDDPNIEKFEEELAPFLHAAMKDSKL